MKFYNLMTTDAEPDIKPAIRLLAGDANPLIAQKGRMILNLVRYLEARGPAPSVFAHLVNDELWLTPASRHNRARVHVAMVWREFGPVRDGYPEMYYRLSIKRRAATLSRDERTSDLSEVERSIREAFGWMTPAIGDPD